MHKPIKLSKISQTQKDIALDLFFMTVGCFIFAASVAVFTAPNKMAPGGVSGIATLLYYTIGSPIGITTLLLNVPLFIFGFKFIGGRFFIKTFYCTIVSSLAVDLLNFLPKYQGNMLLAALYGGIISGIGLGLVFMRGSTTGGTDILSRLIKLKLPHIPMGRMLMVIDALIIIVSIAIFKSVDSGLYALINIFASSKIIDAILYGSDTGKMVLVISNNNNEIAKTIISEIDRGVTMLKGRGFYTGTEREVLLCAVRRQEAVEVRKIVRRTDPSAFIIMCEAGDVIGEGFKPITKEDI